MELPVRAFPGVSGNIVPCVRQSVERGDSSYQGLHCQGLSHFQLLQPPVPTLITVSSFLVIDLLRCPCYTSTQPLLACALVWLGMQWIDCRHA